MASELKNIALADIIEIISGGTPKTNIPEYWDGDIPWLSVSDFNSGYRWVSSAEKSITERGLSESATTILNKGDIIISARGTVGAVAQLSKPMAFNQSCYGIRGKEGVAETDFIYYMLRHAVLQMKQVAHGGVFDTITRDTFKIIEVKHPSLKIQQAIACILGTLDGKIELNRKMNQTLEAMARAIFKSWFVDFDPVRAKAESRDTGLPKHIAKLFPDSFEDSELGEIPKGWGIKALYDIATYVNGRSFNDSHFSTSGLPIIKIAELKSGITDQTKFTDLPIEKKYALNNGDILFSWSGSPDTSINTFIYNLGIGWLNQHIFNVLPHSEEDKPYVYYLLKQWNPEFIEIARNKQTTGLGHVTMTDLKRLQTVEPPKPVKDIFLKLSSPIFEKTLLILNEINTLAALRDILLPKLISGELRIPDSEKIVRRCI